MLPNDKRSTRPIGKSGTSISAGIYTEEYLTSLQGFQAAEVFNKMARSDTDVRKILNAISSPVKAAQWFIEPASEDTKDLEAAALIDQILFKDLNWSVKIHEILTFLRHGYSVFEPVHENKENKDLGQYTGLAGLGFRSQSSLIRWYHDDAGNLQKIEQQRYGDVVVNVEIPAENLLIFFLEKEGDDNGFSILRPLYGAYKRKLLCEELKIIGIERFAIPTPKLQVPSNVTTDSVEYRDAIDVISSFTSAENSYITYPEGWELELVENGTFDPTKIQSTIKSESEAMVGSILATFLELGTGGNAGALALGSDLSDFFMSTLEVFANTVENPVNNQLIPNLIKLNYGDSISTMPKLSHTGITDKAGEEFMRIVTGYIKSGAVTTDELLEDFLRKTHKLPKKAEGEAIENQEVMDDSPDEEQDIEDQEIDENEVDENEQEPEEGDTGDDSPGDADPDTSLADKSNAILLADKKPKDARQLIKQEEKRVQDLMREKLTFMRDKAVADVISKYKQLPESQKIKAASGLKIGGTAKYKRELKGLMTNIANKALDQVYDENPELSDIQLKDNMEIIKGLDSDMRFKFNDNSRLPKHVQALIAIQSEEIVKKQASDLNARVQFQFLTSEDSTKDPDVIRQDLLNDTDKWISGGVVGTGAATSTSVVVNDTRNQFYLEPEVADRIHSYQFTNPDPVTDICQIMNGTIFSEENKDQARFNPPLHHNCKSYITVNLKGAKKLPPPEAVLVSGSGLDKIVDSKGEKITPERRQKALKQITLNEGKEDGSKVNLN